MSDINNESSTMLKAALEYAEMGIKVFPCKPNGKAPLTNCGFKDATTDKDQITTWWTLNPDANIASPTGSGEMIGVAIDIDGADNLWPEDPYFKESLAKGVCVTTPNNGYHYYLSSIEGKIWKSRNGKLAEKVDVKSEGGYVILPPSSINGNGYKFLFPDSDLTELAQPDSWLVELLDTLEKPKTKSTTPSLDEIGKTIPEGSRNDTLTKHAGAFRRYGHGESIIYPALQTLNQEKCIPPIEDSELRVIVKSSLNWIPDENAVLEVSSPEQAFSTLDITTFDMHELIFSPAEPIDFLFDGLIPREESCGLNAEGGSGKSYLALTLAISGAIGRPLFPSIKPAGEFKTLIIQGEEKQKELHRRIQKIMEAFGLSIEDKKRCLKHIKIHKPRSMPLVSPDKGAQKPTLGLYWLQKEVKDFEPDFLIIDPRSRFFAGEENDNNQVTHFLNHLDDLTELTPNGTSVFTLHHSNKSGGKKLDRNSARGAGSATDLQRSTFGMVTFDSATDAESYGIMDDYRLYVLFGHLKANQTELHDTIMFKRETGKNGGVLKEVDKTKLKSAQIQNRLTMIARAIPEIIGDNPNDYSINQLTKADGKKFRAALSENTEAKGKDIKPAFRTAIEHGWLILDKVGVDGRNKTKDVPRAVKPEVVND